MLIMYVTLFAYVIHHLLHFADMVNVASWMCTVLRYYFVLFFFKQKTAYEMRISDWSSDVCSSDLELEVVLALALVRGIAARAAGPALRRFLDPVARFELPVAAENAGPLAARAGMSQTRLADPLGRDGDGLAARGVGDLPLADRTADDLLDLAARPLHEALRSEEHTSELQSLMRISYAVVGLKQKKTKT